MREMEKCHDRSRNGWESKDLGVLRRTLYINDNNLAFGGSFVASTAIVVQISHCAAMTAVWSLTECRKGIDCYKVAGLKTDKYRHPNKSIWCY